ncbi:hypothetical protein Tco_1472233 [Tanacetum coccineum]
MDIFTKGALWDYWKLGSNEIEPTKMMKLPILSGYSEWPTYSWREDGYCNGGNLPGAYIVGNTIHYKDLEWYEALKDSELEEEALRNKAIMEGLINEDDKSSNNGWRRWDGYEIANHDQEEREYENQHKVGEFIGFCKYKC